MRLFHNLKIRTKLIVLFSLIIIIFAIPSVLIIYSSMRSIIKDNLNKQLVQTNESITKLIRSILNTGVKSHLAATALHNREIAHSLHGLSNKGRISPGFARTLTTRSLLAQRIGKTGYIYCLDSNGIIRVHPKTALIGRNLSEYDFIKKQLSRKDGYLTYQWKNPGETKVRKKALSMVYFKPWDWIISVSAYVDEFINLIDLKELRKTVLRHKFGKTGYSYIIDTKGNIVIHPYLKSGTNYLNQKDSSGKYFIREMIRKKHGRIVYDWKNPNEKKARKKFLYYTTLKNPNWIITSSGYTEELYESLSDTGGIFWLSTLFSVVLAVLLSTFLSSYIRTPLRHMISNFQRGSKGDLNLRMPVHSDDEIGELSKYFNEFMEKLNELQTKDRQLRQAQKMEIVGTLAGGLAHDFNNYLGGIMGALAIIEHTSNKRKELDTDKLLKYIKLMRKSGDKAINLITQLQTLSNKKEPSCENSNLTEVIRNTATLAETVLDKSIEIRVELPVEEAQVLIDKAQIEQALLNIFINAAHAMTIMRDKDTEWGGTLEIAVSSITIDDSFRSIHPEATAPAYWVTSIRDNGVGMAEEIRDQIFQPFFTTKEKNEGSGLGLPMVFNIIRQHNGFIGIYSEPNLGTEFNIYLPFSTSDKSIASETTESEPTIPNGWGTILVIDDDENIREIADEMLQLAGYEVLTAQDGESGLKTYQRNHGAIRAVLLDLVMPGISGKEVYDKLRQMNPEIRVILSSGFRDDTRIRSIVRSGDVLFLQKPYSFKQLSETMHSLLM